MNKPELINAIQSNLEGVTKKSIEDFLDAYVKTVKETLEKGEEIKLVNFMNFSINEIAEKQVPVKVGDSSKGTKTQPAYKKCSAKLCDGLRDILK